MNEILLSTGKLICWSASSFTNSSFCPSLSQQLSIGQTFFIVIALIIATVLVRNRTTA